MRIWIYEKRESMRRERERGNGRSKVVNKTRECSKTTNKVKSAISDTWDRVPAPVLIPIRLHCHSEASISNEARRKTETGNENEK